MIYAGSKRRIAKDIAFIISQYRKPDQVFVEPFAGGFNLTMEIPNPRICNDLNHYAIECFRRAVEEDWLPDLSLLTEESYKDIKYLPEKYDPALVGFRGMVSFGGKWMESYPRSKKGNSDYKAQSLRALQKQVPKLKGVKFLSMDYQDIPLPSNSLIYCDPPL